MRRLAAVTLLCSCALAWMLTVVGAAPVPHTPTAPPRTAQLAPPYAAPDETLRLRIPLRQGRLLASDLLRELCPALEIDCGGIVDELQQPIDLRQSADAAGLCKLNGLTHGILSVVIEPDQVTIELDPAPLKAMSVEARQTIAAWIAAQINADGQGESAPRLGLAFVAPEAIAGKTIEQLTDVPQRVVILVHGVDDPGWMWRDMTPALRAEGYSAARFDYPNDGPIADAADRLAVVLLGLRAAGVRHIDLVAKSMGGLVSRDVLTRDIYYDSDGRGNDRLPAVDRLIMIGTPNHGSVMARFRGVSEIAEHISRLWTKNGSGRIEGRMLSVPPWLDFRGDGDGEAGIDLLPDSDFLRRLNARPLATHTRHTIIAGRLCPVSETDMTGWVQRMRQYACSSESPQWLRDLAARQDVDSLTDRLAAAVRGLGDGLVTIDSARLDGVDDFIIIEADHVGLACNVLPSACIPPGLPIIMDRLKAPVE